jgi:protein-disulfide isomerase/uncharacterized membrane protein
MRKKWLIAALIAALLGLVNTGISISEFYKIQKEGLEESSFCSVNDVVNCDIVNASSYSELFGIPVAVWGFLFYLTAVLYSACIRFSKKERRTALSFIWAFSLFGVLWNVRMAYIAVGILHAVCLTCLSQYLISIFLAVAFTFAGRFSLHERFRPIFSKKVFAHAVTLLIIFGIGYVFALSASGDESRPTERDIKELVSAHFRQSLYDIKPEDIADAPVWGNKDAKVMMIEFSDFECPFCRIAAFNVRPYLQEFRDKIKFVFLNYPLDNSCNQYMSHPMHPESCIAAEAAVCAQEKGKFWDYHDLVFKNQRKLDRELLLDLGAQVGIEKGWLEACMDSPATMARIKSDIELAHHIYLNGTPSVFINRRVIRHWRVPEVLREIVRAEIEGSEK